jgi:hypothetical protein
VCHQAQQVFGGMGYIRESGIEQLVRDIRITTIYEGTSQVQVAASIKAVLADVLSKYFEERGQVNLDSIDFEFDIKSKYIKLSLKLEKSREIFLNCCKYVVDKVDDSFTSASAKFLVGCYSDMLAGYLLLEQVEKSNKSQRNKKIITAGRKISYCHANAKLMQCLLKSDVFTDLEDKEIFIPSVS